MESIPLSLAQIVIQILGLPGLIFIIWHFDNKRLDKQREIYNEQQNLTRAAYEKESALFRDQINLVLIRYEKDITSIRTLYENNVHLVHDYDNLSRDLVDTVRLNTQAQQMLCDFLKNKPSCISMMSHGGH